MRTRAQIKITKMWYMYKSRPMHELAWTYNKTQLHFYQNKAVTLLMTVDWIKKVEMLIFEQNKIENIINPTIWANK